MWSIFVYTHAEHRSCKKNFDQFIENFQNCILKFSCIILTETWLTSYRDNIFDISGYHCHDLYRNQYGGGIKLNVKNCVKSKVLNNFTMLNNLFEMLTVELLLGSHKVILTSIYHPPSSSNENNIEFVELFTLQLRQLLEFKIPLILAGDLNLNLLNPNNCIYADIYINNLFKFGLKPLVTIPTKVTLDNPITRFSILDQIWISEELQSERTFVIPVDITDHFPVCTIILFPFFQQCRMGSNKIRPLSAGGRVFNPFVQHSSNHHK